MSRSCAPRGAWCGAEVAEDGPYHWPRILVHHEGHLATNGYLRLVPDPDDRRAKLYVPTERGLELLSACAHIVADYERWLDGIVGPDPVAQLRRTLFKIAGEE